MEAVFCSIAWNSEISTKKLPKSVIKNYALKMFAKKKTQKSCAKNGN